MSKLTTEIGPRAYELIRNRIAEILIDEFDNQFLFSYDPDIDLDVEVERFVPYQISEMNAVNVMLARGDFDNKTAVKSDGNFRFIIDCYANAESTETERGDSLAMFKLQKIMGICQAILESPYYLTLGFARPFIEHTRVELIEISQPINVQEATSMVAGRITFIVRAAQNADTLVPNLIDGYNTGVKIGLTDRGYVFSGTQPVIPPPTCSPVTVTDTDSTIHIVASGGTFICTPIGGGVVNIIDQNDNIIAEVEAPADYQVLVFDEIYDDTPHNIPVDEIVDDVFN